MLIIRYLGVKGGLLFLEASLYNDIIIYNARANWNTMET